jgi:hypothetical protein
MRFAFIVGARNACFKPLSQRKTFEMFDRLEPGRHAYHEFPDYAHLDIFLGQRAAADVYPVILQELAGGGTGSHAVPTGGSGVWHSSWF